MRARMPLKKQTGFTLVELLVALMVLTIFLVSFIAMFVNGMFGISSSGQKSSDIFSTQEELEQMISRGTSEATPLTITLPNSSTISVSGEIVIIENGKAKMSTFIPHQ